ncbi:DUF6270 domain-containing protein [Glutamicibacter sp.]|uniref:DUF6270 domain-containing protein n=1 Tax=Glutamicibacter sp. TaxID=1931995 RepID=UPI002B46DBD2|nr:DUF6270 domain-containing protein [Glutamicibacter sp.]HJX76993.1 DUF6270 domain-containing protein [Glutamicibacter sp.]
MKRVFIYGSCVTRDSEPFFKDYGLELAGYVARQSLISAFRKVETSEFDFSKVASNFQRTMTRGDVEGNLRFEIARTNPDVIIWDICDERLGVKLVKTGGLVTRSRDHIAEGIHPGPFGRFINFGADEHFKLWKRGLDELLKVLKRSGLADRLFLNATPWAVEDEFGQNYNGQAETAEQFNRDADRYLDYASQSGVTVVPTSQSDTISRTDGHRWGPAPFHYVDATYLAMLTNLSNAIRT